MASVAGCGNTICKFNNRGECQVKKVVLNESGRCMLFEPDTDKAEIAAQTEIKMQKIAAEAAKDAQGVVRENEPQARRIGF